MFNDISSEMLIPVMPMYLKSIGFSIVIIGILEGMAEAIAGLSKGYFGNLSDAMAKRLPFVQLGYGISAICKPLIGLFAIPFYVFIIRTLDRLGKGVRTGARDAMLNAEATSETKATVFGFHKAMDTLGATIGPLLALIFLYYNPGEYKYLFMMAIVPGLFSIFATFQLKEKVIALDSKKNKTHFFSFFKYWNKSTRSYKQIVIGFLFFALINTSDIFILLKAKDAGLSDLQVIAAYIFYNLVFALLAFPIGKLADRWRIENIFVIGIVCFAIVYLGMAFASRLGVIILLLSIYSLFAAATDGVAKAWIGNTVNKNEMATATGFYTSFQSICALFSSSIGGLLWYHFGASTTFLVSGIGALFIIFYFIIISKNNKLLAN
jgi:MFS family permease